MSYINWFSIAKISDIEKDETIYLDVVITTQEYGNMEVRVCKGLNFYSLIYQDTYLPIGLNGNNPYKRGNLAAYKDDTDLWLGVIENE